MLKYFIGSASGVATDEHNKVIYSLLNTNNAIYGKYGKISVNYSQQPTRKKNVKML